MHSHYVRISRKSNTSSYDVNNVDYIIGHLLETSLEYFGPNKLRKVIDNIFITLSYKFYKNIVHFVVHFTKNLFYKFQIMLNSQVVAKLC